MNHMDFNPYLIEEHRQQVLEDVLAIRREQRLQENHGRRASQFAALAQSAMRALYRRAGLAR